jgi:hypothetical protein
MICTQQEHKEHEDGIIHRKAAKAAKRRPDCYYPPMFETRGLVVNCYIFVAFVALL